jgi:NADPH:quinone reductase-like Zn-dependent oxidoreductase
MLLSPFVRQKLGTFVASKNAADLMALRALADAGTLAPVIHRTFPLARPRRPSATSSWAAPAASS